MIRSTAAILVSLLALTSPAHAFLADNGKIVTPGAGGDFLVEWSGQSGASKFWCAAGDFAMEGLGLSGATHIYRYDAPPRRRGEGIRFGLDASRAQPTGLLRFQGGNDLTAAYARRFCENPR